MAKILSSSRRFRAAMWLNSEIVAQKPEVTGWENLNKIPKGINPVIAGTHLRSDAPLQIIARELGGKFDIGIALQAGNRKIYLTNALFTLIGQRNFYDIDNITTRETVNGKSMRTDKYPFNPDNYEVMKEAMEKGKTILISAHYSPIYNGILPDKPGFAAAYLAHLSGQRVVLPVALDMYTDDEDAGRDDRRMLIVKNLLTGNRPKTKMTICEPVVFDFIDAASLALMKKWRMERYQKHSNLKPEDQEIARETFKKVRDQDGGKVMRALAKALPPEKRGIWGKKPAE